MDVDERRRLGARIAQARKERGLTQRELADALGITVRSVQNYEAGSIVPWRHLGRIELITRRRAGWLLREEDGGDLQVSLAELARVMEEHQALLQRHLGILRENVVRLRAQREARTSVRDSARAALARGDDPEGSPGLD